jgi:hypothetical protein
VDVGVARKGSGFKNPYFIIPLILKESTIHTRMARKARARRRKQHLKSRPKLLKHLRFQTGDNPIFPYLELFGNPLQQTDRSTVRFANVRHGRPTPATRFDLLHLTRPFQFAQKFYAMRKKY